MWLYVDVVAAAAISITSNSQKRLPIYIELLKYADLIYSFSPSIGPKEHGESVDNQFNVLLLMNNSSEQPTTEAEQRAR